MVNGVQVAEQAVASTSGQPTDTRATLAFKTPAHDAHIGHGDFGLAAVRLERLERHCCEAEKYRLKVAFPHEPSPLTESGRARDLRDWGRWLFTIAANAGRDAYRPAPEELDFDPPAPFTNTAMTRDSLLTALHSLDPNDRKMILLRAEGFNAKEIAEIMGIGHGAVRTRLFRAREKMRDKLGERHG